MEEVKSKGKVEHLSSQDAIEKMREIAKAANICMFVTKLENAPLSARPMATQEVDEEGNIWFFSGRTSEKNEHISGDPKVQLFYSHSSGYEYLSVYGTAEVIDDRSKTAELWTPIAKAWFKEGKNDPDLTLIKVTPLDAYYWDTKDNKMISLIKFAMGALGLNPKDDGGVEGRLNP